MKKKRGITLVEVIISVALIALVMIFLFNLLTDMQYEETHPSYAKENQQARSLIMKTIQNDFETHTLQNVIMDHVSGGPQTIIFQYGDIGNVALKVTENSINYQGETWNIQGKGHYVLDKIKKESNESETCNASRTNCSDYYYFRIVIPVATGYRENTIDDLEFFYIGRKL